VTSGGQYSRHRRASGSTPRFRVAVGVAVGFVIGALVEIFLLLGDVWRSTFEEFIYPISFVVAIGGVVFGGYSLLGAEREKDWPRALRAAAVFVASAVLAALLFWGAL
jgi:hypothetical protein